LIDPVPNAEKRRVGLLLEYHRPSVIAKGAALMDILLIMFGALMSMTTALTFIEVRRIRKRLEQTNASLPKASAAQV
jgi:hypothetical protein